MITILGYWIANGHKDPYINEITLKCKADIETYRKELAEKHRVKPVDVLFKYKHP